MTFDITQKDRFKYLYKPLLIILLLCFVFALILKYYYSYDLLMFLKFFLGTYIGQSFLFLIPLIIFFHNYLNKDRGTTLTIEGNGESFLYQNKDINISFTENDIEKVIFHLSPPLYDKRSTWLYWDDYFYSEIITSKGVFKISCLVINNLEEFVKEEKTERKKVYFPLIKN